jgi:hypothetical protein
MYDCTANTYKTFLDILPVSQGCKANLKACSIHVNVHACSYAAHVIAIVILAGAFISASGCIKRVSRDAQASSVLWGTPASCGWQRESLLTVA